MDVGARQAGQSISESAAVLGVSTTTRVYRLVQNEKISGSMGKTALRKM